MLGLAWDDTHSKSMRYGSGQVETENTARSSLTRGGVWRGGNLGACPSAGGPRKADQTLGFCAPGKHRQRGAERTAPESL